MYGHWLFVPYTQPYPLVPLKQRTYRNTFTLIDLPGLWGNPSLIGVCLSSQHDWGWTVSQSRCICWGTASISGESSPLSHWKHKVGALSLGFSELVKEQLLPVNSTENSLSSSSSLYSQSSQERERMKILCRLLSSPTNPGKKGGVGEPVHSCLPFPGLIKMWWEGQSSLGAALPPTLVPGPHSRKNSKRISRASTRRCVCRQCCQLLWFDCKSRDFQESEDFQRNLFSFFF